jgi:hypothetical protein
MAAISAKGAEMKKVLVFVTDLDVSFRTRSCIDRKSNYLSVGNTFASGALEDINKREVNAVIIDFDMRQANFTAIVNAAEAVGIPVMVIAERPSDVLNTHCVKVVDKQNFGEDVILSWLAKVCGE